MQKNQTSIAQNVACSQEKLSGGGHPPPPMCGRGLMYIESKLQVVPNLFFWRAVAAEHIYAKDDMMNVRHFFHFSVQPSWLKMLTSGTWLTFWVMLIKLHRTNQRQLYLGCFGVNLSDACRRIYWISRFGELWVRPWKWPDLRSAI